MQRADRLREFVAEIWQWYAKNKRRLPWRDLTIADDTQRAYMILVSEVMLQQTQVPRVQILFPRFLKKFPTIHDLAKASNRDVLIAWRGMGYNGRALRLRDAARMIVERGFPQRIGTPPSWNSVPPSVRNAVQNVPNARYLKGFAAVRSRFLFSPLRTRSSKFAAQSCVSPAASSLGGSSPTALSAEKSSISSAIIRGD